MGKQNRKVFFVLRCSASGWEQAIKRRTKENIEVLEEMKQAKAVYCDRRVCRETRKVEIPPGHIEVVFWFGGWSFIRPATLEEYRSIKRAKAIREAGLRQLEEQSKV